MSKHKFTKSNIPTQKFDSFEGIRIIEAIPKLVASGMRFGNFRDLGRGRMPQYNSNENDRKILYDNWFDLSGNPILGNPDGKWERVVIFDLEQKDLEPIKTLVAGLNSATELNSLYSLEISSDIYQLAKESDGSFVIKPSLVTDLMNNPHSHNRGRSGFIRKLFHENTDESNGYITDVKDHHQVKNMDNILGFYPGNFTGLRLLYGGSVGFDSGIVGYDLGSGGCLLGVSDGVASTEGTIASDKQDLEEKLIITSGEPFIHEDFKYEPHNGIYLASPINK